MSPQTDDIHARLQALSRSDDALELRLALARQSFKAAQAHSESPDFDSHNRASELLRRAQNQLKRAS
ncbi:MAG: hypothetical protein V3V20_03560 [Algisphaera sp.]